MNEKLQKVFKELTTRTEQDEYSREGIAWNRIPFFDSEIVCKLIESSGRGGFLKKLFGGGVQAGKYPNN